MHSSRREDLVNLLASSADQLNSETEVGLLITKQEVDRVANWVEEAAAAVMVKDHTAFRVD